MQLLISVAGPAEARAALLGGADVIDAKDPRRGALGPVSLQRLAAIRAAVAGARPLSAAVGDATSEQAVAGAVAAARSGERRVGKEWRSRGSPYHSKKKKGGP